MCWYFFVTMAGISVGKSTTPGNMVINVGQSTKGTVSGSFDEGFCDWFWSWFG